MIYARLSCRLPLVMCAVLLASTIVPSRSIAAPGYSGQVTGSFNTVVKNGEYIKQTAGANAQVVPTYNFVTQNNAATAVSNINNGAAISTFTWGNAVGLNPQPAITQSSVSWVPVAFNNVAPDTPFLLGKIIYTNGTIVLSTGTYGATLSLSGLNITDNMGAALPVAVTGLDVPFTNWDTTNLTSGNAGAVKGLAGNNVVNAAGQLFDNLGNALLDNLGNQLTVPGPSFYDTFWSTDYISFDADGPYANFDANNDAGTFEGKQAVFDVMGRIVGDPQIFIDSIVLDDSSLGTGFVVPDSVEISSQSPEPSSLVLFFAGASVMGFCRRRGSV